MDELIKTITSISWWFGVVGVSFAINLLSAYAKSPLDSLLAGISRQWQQRSKASRARHQAKIDALRSDKHLQVLYIAREQRHRQQEIAWLAMVTVFIVMEIGLKVLSRLPIEAGKAPIPMLFDQLIAGMGLLSLVMALASRLSASSYMGMVEDAAFGNNDR